MGCAASAKGKYGADTPVRPGQAPPQQQQHWASPSASKLQGAGSTGPAQRPRQVNQDHPRDGPRSYRSGQKVPNGTGFSLASTVDSAHFTSTSTSLNESSAQEPVRTKSQPWEVTDFESRPCSEDQDHSQVGLSPNISGAFADAAAQPTPTRVLSASWDWSDSSCWWSDRAEWIQTRAAEITAAYNFFFEHIGLRKGWRTSPFEFDEVQAPFRAAAEVVVVVRARLDAERGGVLVLRQVEGSAMNFLWGWSPSRPPGSSHKALEEFFRGLVFATLSDGRGLVEGLDTTTVESYVCRHPLLASDAALAAAEAAEAAEAAGGAEAPAPDAEAMPVAACD